MRPPRMMNQRRSWVTDSYRRYATKHGRVSVTKIGKFWYVDDWHGAEAVKERPWTFNHVEDALEATPFIIAQRALRG